VADYLLKPISFERFVKAVEKVHEKLLKHEEPRKESAAPAQAPARPDYFFVKSGFKLHKVKFEEILCIEGQGDYLKIITPKARIMTLQTFKGIEEILPPGNFLRVHKSYIIALDKIDSIEGNTIRIGEMQIPVGESYKTQFQAVLERRKIV